MSVRSDVINLTVNVNGNESLNKLNDLRKKAADINLELKGLKKNSEEFAAKKKELEGVTNEMTDLKKQIGITALTLKELRRESKALTAMRDSVLQGTEEWKKYNSQLQKVNSRMKEVGNATQGAAKHTSMMGDVAKGIGIAAVFDKALSAVTNFFRGSIEEAEHAEKVASRLRNNLDNLGEVDAFDRLSEKADQLAARFKFIDNDDVVEVFNQLITYGKLTEKQMDELLPVITDFAAKSGMSMSESTSVVIKALEGNSKALKEYGIDMADGANVTERMSILMKELKPRVERCRVVFGRNEYRLSRKICTSST
jgi:predicted  nucleic acid-binding Zn-ribbon protein